MTQQLVFCEQCGNRIPASARHCRACGAEQEILTIDPGARGDSEGVEPAAASAVDPGSAGRPAVGQPGAPPPPRQALDPRAGRFAERARRFGDEALAPRVAAAFPGRSLSDVALPTLGGGFVALAVACVGAWAILMLIAGEEDLPLFDLARFAVPLALGAPLVAGAEVGDAGGEAGLQIPLTGLVLVPLAATALGGYLSAHWFGPRSEGEAWRIGALIGGSFALALILVSVSFAAEVPVPALPFLDEELSFAEFSIRAGALETAVYGCLWGSLGGALGGGLYGRRRFHTEGLRSRIARTRATSRHMAAIEGAVRAFGVAMVGLASLAVVAFLLAFASEPGVRELAEEPLLLLVGVVLLVPTAALLGLYFSQGVGYETRGALRGLAADDGSEGGILHFWDQPESMFFLIATAVVAYALVRGGRRVAHAVGGTDARAFVKAGATIAIPWIALLLLVRQLASAKVSASAFGLFEQSSSVAPSFGETIFFAGVLAALAGAAGGALAWGEGRSREAATLGRAFGRIDRPPAASRPYAPPPGSGGVAQPYLPSPGAGVAAPPHAPGPHASPPPHVAVAGSPDAPAGAPPPRPAPPSPAPDAPGRATMVHSTPAGGRGGRFATGAATPSSPPTASASPAAVRSRRRRRERRRGGALHQLWDGHGAKLALLPLLRADGRLGRVRSRCFPARRRRTGPVGGYSGRRPPFDLRARRRPSHTPARQPSGVARPLDDPRAGLLLLVLGAGGAGFAVVRLTSSSKEVDEGAAPGREKGAAEEPTDGARGPEGGAPAEPADGYLAGGWSGSGVQRAPRGTRQSVSIGVNLGSLSGDGSAGIQTEAIEDEDGGTSRCRGRLTLERRSSSGVSRFTYTETHDPRNCIRRTHVTLGRTPNGSLAFRETYSTSLGTGTVTGNLKQAERVP